MARSVIKGTKGKPVKKAKNRSSLKVAYDLPRQTKLVPGAVRRQEEGIREVTRMEEREKRREGAATKYNKNKWPWQKKKSPRDFTGKK